MDIRNLTICLKGAGDLATGVAWRLHRAGFSRILMLEVEKPLAVRRAVSFCEAVYEGRKQVEGLEAVLIDSPSQAEEIWQQGKLAVLVDPTWQALKEMSFDVVVDAIIAKRNLGTTLDDAPLVIGLGPGFKAGADVHRIVETKRGHTLGRVLDSGKAAPNTGIPGVIAGFSAERVLKAPTEGVFETSLNLGDMVEEGQVIATVGGVEVKAMLGGMIRGLLRNNTPVARRTKLGDIDPRRDPANLPRISDKALAIAGGVLEATLAHCIKQSN